MPGQHGMEWYKVELDGVDKVGWVRMGRLGQDKAGWGGMGQVTEISTRVLTSKLRCALIISGLFPILPVNIFLNDKVQNQ